MSEARPGLRERKNERTRQAITEATLHLTLERGFEATTIAAIAERADVAPRTVFAWFASKEDIVLGSVDRTLQRLHDAVAGDDGDVLDRIESWLDDARLAHDEGEHQRLRYRALAADPYLRARERELLITTEEAIAAAVARELDQPTGGVGPRAFAAAVISVLLRLRERYMAMPEDAGARDEREEGFAFLRGGITALRQVGQTADS